MWWRDPQRELWVRTLYEHAKLSLQALVHNKHVKVRKNLRWCRARDLFELQIPVTTEEFEL